MDNYNDNISSVIPQTVYGECEIYSDLKENNNTLID